MKSCTWQRYLGAATPSPSLEGGPLPVAAQMEEVAPGKNSLIARETFGFFVVC